MRIYLGAVCFVDILGIGALTRGQIPLEPVDFAAHCTSGSPATHSHFAASLLTAFRAALSATKKRYRGLSVAQLSDCAFIWTEDIETTTNAARHLMWANIRQGVFCRAGLAYGEIVEPDLTNRSLGSYVLGDAATTAVELERSGKGCRVFTNVDFVRTLQSGRPYTRAPFQPLRNPLDGTSSAEFIWYLHAENLGASPGASIEGLAELSARLQFSPLFNWNCATPLGNQHMAVSVESVTKALTLASGVEMIVPVEHLIDQRVIRSERKMTAALAAYLAAVIGSRSDKRVASPS